MIFASIVLWLALLLAIAFMYYVRYVEPSQLVTHHVEVQIPDLPDELQGLKIGHLTDTHVKDTDFSREMAERAVHAVMASAPDVLCITGDIGHNSCNADAAVKTLAPLEAEYGVYAVPGNHDMDESLELSITRCHCEVTTIPEWSFKLEGIGIDLLFNEHRVITVDRSTVVIAGTGDVSSGYDDLDTALENAPRGDLNILLSHSPDIFDHPAAEWADLILCGHTHGGQLQLPLIGVPWAPVWRRRDRSQGLMRVGAKTVAYVNRGVGSGTRARFRCPPEVAIIELSEGYDDSLHVVK